jgi:glutamate-1-semialdehyde aminotransferase
MKYLGIAFTGLALMIAGFVTFNYIVEAEPQFRTLDRSTPTIRNLKSEMIKVDGVEYLVVNTPSGVGVCFAMTKNNFKRIAEMIGEMEGEINAEKLNKILQNNKGGNQ